MMTQDGGFFFFKERLKTQLQQATTQTPRQPIPLPFDFLCLFAHLFFRWPRENTNPTALCAQLNREAQWPRGKLLLPKGQGSQLKLLESVWGQE